MVMTGRLTVSTAGLHGRKQGGIGAEKARAERFRPRLGLRLIREL
ncbi:hypothetical protein [Sphingomonas zeae]|jgi:hypothetical protein